LWCWISPRWDIFRIAIFYGPVWIVMLITFFIYIRAGREIYKKHKQLKEFSTSHHDPEPLAALDDLFSSSKTTEVHVTTEVVDKNAIDLAPLGGADDNRQGGSGLKPPKAAYSVTISSSQREANREPHATIESAVLTNVTTDSHITAGSRGNGGGTGVNPLRRRAAYEANSATWSYTKCAILFFTAMLVTWLPSSANRVYSVVHTGETSLPLEYMSAFVLPLQGFWNAIIYVVTSWGACRMLWEDVCSWSSRRRPNAEDLMPGRAAFQMMSSGRNGSKPSEGNKAFETESMTELAGTRPGSSSGPGSSMDAPTANAKT
jgi:hypothetical protein